MKSRFRPQTWIICVLFACIVSGCGARDEEPVFDVPSLLGKNIDEATAILGAPTSEDKSETGAPRRVWTRDGKTLAATWKESSRRVTAWTLIARADDNALRDEEKTKLLRVGKLPENDARYSLEWIEAAERPLFYVGARIVPAPRNYNVTLRLSGSLSMVQMSYQPVQPTAVTGGGAFLTITPWETSFVAPDDSKISLSASLEKRLDRKGAFGLKAEIWVDGKLASQASSVGLPFRCEYEL